MPPLQRTPPGPGQESVWDYPRPPRVEPSTRRVQVTYGGRLIADTTRAMRVLETSHPPVYYIPQDDVDMSALTRTPRATFCEYKGQAHYYTLSVNDALAENAAWGYDQPSAGYEALAGHIAFYPTRMDACTVDGERVQAQAGDFYGGWVTSEIVGPFKGGPGTWGW